MRQRSPRRMTRPSARGRTRGRAPARRSAPCRSTATITDGSPNTRLPAGDEAIHRLALQHHHQAGDPRNGATWSARSAYPRCRRVGDHDPLTRGEHGVEVDISGVAEAGGRPHHPRSRRERAEGPSISYAITLAPVAASERVRVPAPAPISTTFDSGPTPAISTMRRTTFGRRGSADRSRRRRMPWRSSASLVSAPPGAQPPRNALVAVAVVSAATSLTGLPTRRRGLTDPNHIGWFCWPLSDPEAG